MLLDVHQTYFKIEKDIIANQESVFNLYNYYTHKYRGNRINDVNVGLFLNDSQQPTVQIFVRNKTGYIKSHLLFNKAGDTIINIKILNTTF